MADFEVAHTFSAQWEGGLTNHPHDPGGITNFGVSLRWLRSMGLVQGDIDGDGDIDADDIRALTARQAATLFKRMFWDTYQLGALPQQSAICHYDCMINTGPRQATLITQRACNRVIGPYGVRLAEDGIFGPRTRTFLVRYTTARLIDAMLDLRECFYRDLVISKPNFAPFEKGWLNRCKALRRYVSALQ